MDITNLFPNNSRSDYQRYNYDKFLKEVRFSYNVPSIHITGTNGKGSVATYIAAILKSAGYKVGLYTSPYFYEMNEMIKINDEEIKDEEILKYISKYKKYFEKYDLSVFEIETFIGLSYFADRKVDFAVIECGMGGEVDATNVFTPILSIITTVSLEHTAFLGNSLYEIAAHKAGIIKKDVPVVLGKLPQDAEATITDIARDLNAQIYKVNETYNIKQGDIGVAFSYEYYQDIELGSYAAYSCYDASTALEAINVLIKLGKISINDKNIILNALRNTHIINRMEVLSNNPTIIVDGAHNPEAIIALKESMNARYYDKNVHIVFASFRDKNISLMLPELGLVSEDITLTTFDHPRARQEDEYFLYLADYKYEDDYVNLINKLIKDYPDDIILVTGSLAFTGVVRKAFKEGKLNG